MSGLVDAARRLAGSGLIDDGAHNEYQRRCIMCGAETDELPPSQYGYEGHPAQPHAPDCPALALPAIVRALEAAERVVRDPSEWPQGHGETVCVLGQDFIALEDALNGAAGDTQCSPNVPPTTPNQPPTNGL